MLSDSRVLCLEVFEKRWKKIFRSGLVFWGLVCLFFSEECGLYLSIHKVCSWSDTFSTLFEILTTEGEKLQLAL